MRKFAFYILVVFILISMAGCTNQGESFAAEIPKKIESNFNADHGQLKLSGHISKLETGICTITITEPKSLEGAVFTYIGDKITASLDGVRFEISSEDSPASGFVKSVAEALATASNPDAVTVTKAEGYNKYSVLDNVYLLQEQKSGNITSLVIKNADISVNFIG